MRPSRCAALVLAAVVTLSACSEDDEQPGPTGQLRVIQPEFPKGSTDGTVSFVELAAGDGEVVMKAQRLPGDRSKVIVGRSGRPTPVGRYDLRAYQRPCEGNCGSFGPVTRDCSVGIEVKKAQKLTARVDLRTGQPCSISTVAG